MIKKKWHEGKLNIIAGPATTEDVTNIYELVKKYLGSLTIEEHSHTYITQSMNQYSFLVIIHTPPFREDKEK